MDFYFWENFDFWQTLVDLITVLVAFILALPIGWNREMATRSIGLRTFPLVSVGACGFMLVGITVFDSHEAQARVAYGIVTGIGFIGGGAILKDGGSVHGTATAASIWNTGAIGLAVAYQQWELAFVLALINLATLRYVAMFKDKLDRLPDDDGEKSPGRKHRGGAEDADNHAREDAHTQSNRKRANE